MKNTLIKKAGQPLTNMARVFQPTFDQTKDIENIMNIDVMDKEIVTKQMTKGLKLQDEIFINAAHELKTPLNLIYSTSQLLDIYLENDCLEDVRENIIDNNQVIIRNCYRLTKLVNNILDISKIESGFYELNLRNVNIVEIIDNTIQSVVDYIKISGLKIVFSTEIKELIVAVDPHKVERVLLNLISNAIKFSGPHGVILVKLTQKDNFLEISVRDNGIGIDSDDLDIIFEKFVQLDKSLSRISEGAGIGLHLVKSIVKLHGGQVNVESTLGKGSTFKIELPIKTVNNVNGNQDKNYSVSKMDTIKYELSDIYIKNMM